MKKNRISTTTSSWSKLKSIKGFHAFNVLHCFTLSEHNHYILYKKVRYFIRRVYRPTLSKILYTKLPHLQHGFRSSCVLTGWWMMRRVIKQTLQSFRKEGLKGGGGGGGHSSFETPLCDKFSSSLANLFIMHNPKKTIDNYQLYFW